MKTVRLSARVCHYLTESSESDGRGLGFGFGFRLGLRCGRNFVPGFFTAHTRLLHILVQACLNRT